MRGDSHRKNTRMTQTKRRSTLRGAFCLTVALAFLLTGLAASGSVRGEALAAGEETDAEPEDMYVENEWNFVDGSMDISEGIPEDAAGRLGEIRDAGRLTVATEPYFAPQEFIDPALTGQEKYVGADMELAKRIAERMGVELEIVPLDFSDVLPMFAEGKYDLAISGLAYTPGRAGMVELSKGYHFSDSEVINGLVIREEDKERIRGTQDLADKNLVVQSNSLQEALMVQNITAYRQFLRVSSIQEVYDALSEGRADAATVDFENAGVYLSSHPDCGLYLVPGTGFQMEEQFEGDRIACKKDELQLMYFVNGVIDEVLAEGLYEKWFDEYSAYASRLGVE